MQDVVLEGTAGAAGMANRNQGAQGSLGSMRPAARPGRRITADSFRQLTARLKGVAIPDLMANVPAVEVIPELLPPGPVVRDAAYLPPASKAEPFDAPVAAPLGNDEAAGATGAASDGFANDAPPPLPDFDLPVFRPLDAPIAPPPVDDYVEVVAEPEVQLTPIAAEAVELDQPAPESFEAEMAPSFDDARPSTEAMWPPEPPPVSAQADDAHEEALSFALPEFAPLSAEPLTGAPEAPLPEISADYPDPALPPLVDAPPQEAEEASSAPETLTVAAIEPVDAAVPAEDQPMLEAPAETIAAPQPVETAVTELADVAEPAEASPAAVAPVTSHGGEAPHQPAAPASEKAVSPLANKVVEAMMKTVSSAIFARPSDDERTAFLREVAALMEAEGIVLPVAEAKDAAASSLTLPNPDLPQPSQPAPIEDGQGTPPDGLSNLLAGRLGNSSSLLRKAGGATDPFAKTAQDTIRRDPKPVETPEADEDAGELARSLLDMMSSSGGSALPQERALAADTLLRLVPRIPVKALLGVVDRLAIMEQPPSLLVAKLIRDPRPEVAGPLLERCSHISDQDLANAIADGSVSKQRMIARRRVLSPALTDHLIAQGDPSVLLTLVRNPGASLSHEAYYRLGEFASQHHALLAPLATRADLPPPVAFELFWFVPPELRRFIFSRFLTDSETLNRILKITMATHAAADAGQAGDIKFPNRELVEQVVDLAVKGNLDEASQLLSEIGGICSDCAIRVLSDRDGEPIAVLLKALGYARGKFTEAIERLKHSDCGILRSDRNAAELQGIFDTLSFNKARILLTYWDWFVQKTGPYAPQH